MFFSTATVPKKKSIKAFSPTNMASVSDKHGPFRQCIQILGTLDMYPDFGYIAIFALFQDKDSQGVVMSHFVLLNISSVLFLNIHDYIIYNVRPPR